MGTLCVLALLAGCVTVPTSGPVEHHAPAEQQANPGVDIAPVPPAQGASPGLIVEGFLHAMATYQPRELYLPFPSVHQDHIATYEAGIRSARVAASLKTWSPTAAAACALNTSSRRAD